MPLPETFVKGFHDEAACSKMEYLPFGKTGLSVSKVALGGGTFSNFYGDYDEKEAIAAVHYALKSGINYIDTAPYYGEGQSEKFLCKALKDIPRKAYYIATKVGRYTKQIETAFDFSAKKVKEGLDESLHRLGLDYVDIIQIHDIEFAPNLDIIINETLPAVEEIVKEGKAKYIGVTGFPLKPLKDAILAAPGRFDMILSYSHYTLLDDSFKEYIPFFQEQNLGIVCAAGHALGLLTNDGHQDWHPATDEVKEMCRKAAAICKESDIELGKLAMYYFMQLDGPSTFLVGMQTRKLIDINLKAYYDGLTKKEQEVLKQLRKSIFTKSVSWEGIELEKYWADMKKIMKQ